VREQKGKERLWGSMREEIGRSARCPGEPRGEGVETRGEGGGGGGGGKAELFAFGILKKEIL